MLINNFLLDLIFKGTLGPLQICMSALFEFTLEISPNYSMLGLLLKLVIAIILQHALEWDMIVASKNATTSRF